MSHIATNWAFALGDLRPAEKLLLLCLADCHNPRNGCFPSQSYLAETSCMSRAAVNDNLARLEEKGHIQRVRSVDPTTRRQRPTRYILGFEPEFAQSPCPETGHGETRTEKEHEAEPCPETGHGAVSRLDPEPCPDSPPSRVQNLDTNPVREPIREPVNDEDDARERARLNADFVKSMAEAFGEPSLAESGYWPIEARDGRYREAWTALGLTEAQMIATARAFALEKPDLPQGPRALGPAMARAAKNASGSKSSRRSRGAESPRASLDERVEFWRKRLTGSGYIAPNAISSEVRGALLARGHVTEAQLRKRGV